MKAGAAFLDSGIFSAFLERSDRFHPAAVELFSNPPRRCHTSLAIVAETYGWFLHRLGEEAARTFRLALADFSWLTLTPSIRRIMPPSSRSSNACAGTS